LQCSQQAATVVCFWDLCHCQLLLQVLLLATETALRGYGISARAYGRKA
jgi:hypothetical protein